LRGLSKGKIDFSHLKKGKCEGSRAEELGGGGMKNA